MAALLNSLIPEQPHTDEGKGKGKKNELYLSV